jgi:hypothetical protein
LADQAAKLSFASAESLETMSEADMPMGFNRMNRFRQSLPLSRSASQSKLRSPGLWRLIYCDIDPSAILPKHLETQENKGKLCSSGLGQLIPYIEIFTRILTFSLFVQNILRRE